MLARPADLRRLLVVRLDPGEDILASLQAAVGAQDLRNGLILNGVGSISCYHVHVVATTGLPPRNTFMRGEGAYDILSLTGAVMDGRVHAHITFGNTEMALGGHMEEGCRVLTLGLAVLAETPGLEMGGWDELWRRFIPPGVGGS